MPFLGLPPPPPVLPCGCVGVSCVTVSRRRALAAPWPNCMRTHWDWTTPSPLPVSTVWTSASATTSANCRRPSACTPRRAVSDRTHSLLLLWPAGRSLLYFIINTEYWTWIDLTFQGYLRQCDVSSSLALEWKISRDIRETHSWRQTTCVQIHAYTRTGVFSKVWSFS